MSMPYPLSSVALEIVTTADNTQYVTLRESPNCIVYIKLWILAGHLIPYYHVKVQHLV